MYVLLLKQATHEELIWCDISVYVNSMLASLNARARIRRQMEASQSMPGVVWIPEISNRPSQVNEIPLVDIVSRLHCCNDALANEYFLTRQFKIRVSLIAMHKQRRIRTCWASRCSLVTVPKTLTYLILLWRYSGFYLYATFETTRGTTRWRLQCLYYRFCTTSSWPRSYTLKFHEHTLR